VYYHSFLFFHTYPAHRHLPSFPTRRSSDLAQNYHVVLPDLRGYGDSSLPEPGPNLINYSFRNMAEDMIEVMANLGHRSFYHILRSEEHTSELQSRGHLVCRLLLEKKK